MRFLDAPVSGGQAGAESGQLSVMAGGDAEALETVRPALDSYSKAIKHMGPSGAGQLTKMVNQIAIAGVVQGLAEAVHFAQVAGLRYALDPAAPAGSRISDVQVKAAEGWAPIDPEASYGIVTNNYLRGGGDGYAMFATEATDAYDFGPDLADVLAEWLAQQGAGFKPAVDGRITVMPLREEILAPLQALWLPTEESGLVGEVVRSISGATTDPALSDAG